MTFPQVTGLKAKYFGVTGGATSTSYYVQAVFPGGRSAIAGPVTITTPAALTNDNRVLVQWDAIPGAISYDILKNTTGTVPTGLATVGLDLGQTANSYNDVGAASVAYNVLGGTGGLTLATAADTATLTAAQMVGQPAVLTVTPTAAASLTTPTATLLIAAMLAPVANGVAYRLIIKNTSAGANTITMLAGSGVTLTGTMTIAQSTYREFLIVPTNLGTPAVTVFAIGSGTF